MASETTACSSATTDSSSYSGTTKDWSNPTNIYTSNNVRATVSLDTPAFDPDDHSYWLVATGFGHTIPGGATIDGFQFDVEGLASNVTSIKDHLVYAVKAGVIQAVDRADTAYWLTSDTVMVKGTGITPADLWGDTWSVSDVNHSGFGVAISVKNLAVAVRSASIDYISSTVYYTAAASGTHQKLVSKKLAGKLFGKVG